MITIGLIIGLILVILIFLLGMACGSTDDKINDLHTELLNKAFEITKLQIDNLYIKCINEELINILNEQTSRSKYIIEIERRK